MSEIREAERPPLPGLRRNTLWWSIQFFVQNLCAFWLQYRVRGLERIPDRGALLLVNHQSFIDPLLVGVGLRRPVSFVARENLFRIPALGWILRNTYVMPIRRDAAGSETLRESIRRIEDGYLVGIFPEGTRTEDGTLGDLKPGFIALVRRAECPVIPVGIAGAFEALPRGAKWLRRSPVRVVFGEPIGAEELQTLKQRGRETALVTLMTDRMRACVEQAAAWRAESK